MRQSSKSRVQKPKIELDGKKIESAGCGRENLLKPFLFRRVFASGRQGGVVFHKNGVCGVSI
jgi:hypothetical protein